MDSLFIPLSMYSFSFSRVKVPGLASIVISALLIMLKFARSPPIICAILPCASIEGVPPPIKTVSKETASKAALRMEASLTRAAIYASTRLWSEKDIKSQ